MATTRETTRYADMTLEELRSEAKKRGFSGYSKMKKAELADALEKGGSDELKVRRSEGKREAGSGGTSGSSTAETKSTKRIRSADDGEGYPGQTLVTRNHDAIRAWAEARNAIPATVPGTEHEGRAGVLRFDFLDYDGEDEGLEHISWNDWFETFDARNLNFIYQEHKRDGSQSNFFRLENPDREDG